MNIQKESSKKMKLLFFFCPNIYPIDEGNKRLADSILSYLSKFHNTFDITLLSFTLKDQRIPLPINYVVVQKKFLAFFLRATHFLCRCVLHMPNFYIHDGLFYKLFCKNYFDASDVIIINYLSWISLLSKEQLKRSIVIIHDIWFFRYKSFSKKWNLWNKIMYYFLKKIELNCLHKCPKIVVLGEYEKNILIENNIDAQKIIVIGLPIKISRDELLPPAKAEYDFIFLGGNSPQNSMAFSLFWEKIALRLPQIPRVALVGNLCSRPNVISLSQKHPQIVRIGFVDKLSDILHTARFVIGVVDSGSGIKVKVVEAMLNGCPVVANNKGLEGIPYTNETAINIDQDPDYISAIEKLLLDDDRRTNMGKAAKALIEKEFSFEKRLEILKTTCEEIFNCQRTSR